MRQFFLAVASLAVLVAFLVMFTDAIQNPVYQNGLTARFDALQQTKRVQAQEWGDTQRVQAQEFGDTLRTWGMWGGGGLAVVGGLVAIGWAVNRWQEQRTQRHVATEEQTTERLRITAKRDVVLAYIAQCGDPGARQMRLNGVSGVYLPQSNEFVPEEVCRAELATVHTTALARRTPPTINVPAQDWPPVGVPGQDGRVFKVIGELEDWS